MELLLFNKSNCAPCNMVKKFIADNEEFSGANIVYVDVENRPDIAGDNGIMSVPTIILKDNGKETFRVTGFNYNKLQELSSKL